MEVSAARSVILKGFSLALASNAPEKSLRVRYTIVGIETDEGSCKVRQKYGEMWTAYPLTLSPLRKL